MKVRSWWEGSTKFFCYDDDVLVAIDFFNNTKTVRWYCACCKTYSAVVYNHYAICYKCRGSIDDK